METAEATSSPKKGSAELSTDYRKHTFSTAPILYILEVGLAVLTAGPPDKFLAKSSPEQRTAVRVICLAFTTQALLWWFWVHVHTHVNSLWSRNAKLPHLSTTSNPVSYTEQTLGIAGSSKSPHVQD